MFKVVEKKSPTTNISGEYNVLVHDAMSLAVIVLSASFLSLVASTARV
jgi:hypothetical protein